MKRLRNKDEIRPYLIKDIDEGYGQTKGSFSALSNYEYGMPYKEYKEMGYYLDINVRDNNDNSKDYTYTIQLDEGFENTKEYLNLK